MTSISEHNIQTARAYYTAMGDKSLEGLAVCLHPEASLLSPMAKIQGRAAIIEAAKGLMAFFDTWTIRTVVGNDHQVMMAHTMNCPAPLGAFPAATLLEFKDGLIASIELFYDTRPLIAQREAIFGK